MSDFATALAAVWPTAAAILVLGFLVGFSAFVLLSEQARRKEAAARAAIVAEALALARAKDARHREQAERAQATRKASPAMQRLAAEWFRIDAEKVSWLDDEWAAILAATEDDGDAS